jgi:hypothetical protein
MYAPYKPAKVFTEKTTASPKIEAIEGKIISNPGPDQTSEHPGKDTEAFSLGPCIGRVRSTHPAWIRAFLTLGKLPSSKSLYSSYFML